MLKSLRREPGFYRRLLALALPLILQNLITTALGFVDTFMVGLIGSNELSAVTAANTAAPTGRIAAISHAGRFRLLVQGRNHTDAGSRNNPAAKIPSGHRP